MGMIPEHQHAERRRAQRKADGRRRRDAFGRFIATGEQLPRHAQVVVGGDDAVEHTDDYEPAKVRADAGVEDVELRPEAHGGRDARGAETRQNARPSASTGERRHMPA